MTDKVFKAGDLVRALASSYGSGPAYVKGRTYIVKSQRGDCVQTEMDSSGSTTNGWDARYFELVQPEKPTKPKAIQTQVGGTHYTDMAIQPASYIFANGIGWAEGDAISYISRWRNKGGLQDLRKARSTLLLLIESEEAKGTA